MTETVIRSSGSRRPSARLRRRAPASIQIGPVFVPDWKIPIPLLTPLATSSHDLTAQIRSLGRHQERDPEEKPKPEYKKWQHPAAPFGFESAPLMAFVYTVDTTS